MRIKKLTTIIFLCFLGGALIPVVLFVASQKMEEQEYAFVRFFPPHVAARKSLIDLRYNSYYVAGFSKAHVLLGNYTKSDLVLTMSGKEFTDTASNVFDFGNTALLYPAIRIEADEAHVYFAEGISSKLLEGTVSSSIVAPHTTAVNFSKATPISPRSFAISRYDEVLKQNVLSKVWRDTTALFPQYVPQKQVDGFFCTDGTLRYSRSLKKIIYTFFYRNEIIVLDTTLHEVAHYRTIDPIAQAQISVKKLSNEETSMMASPPLLVNINARTDGDYLFVHSGLMARNEYAATHKAMSVMDVYDLTSGKYKASFYLPDVNQFKVRDFAVRGKHLVALHDHYAAVYELALK